MFNFIKSLFKPTIIKRERSRENAQNNASKLVNQAIRDGKPVHILLNDPTTPEFALDVALPNLPPVCPKFAINGFTGIGTPVGSQQWQASQIYFTMANTLNLIQRSTNSPLTHWGRTGTLGVQPRAGADLNAFYDGKGLHFFYAKNPATNKIVYTADSTDIVSHELGHAILDAIRPDLWSTQSIEVWSFHEAFGDMVALLSTMEHDSMLHAMLEQTNNDPSKSNVISRLAEELGNVIYQYTPDKNSRRSDALRDAVNSFKYVTPESLPQSAPENQLACECHSFGRVFLGAFYEMMNKIYVKEVGKGHAPIDALKITRDVSAKILLMAVHSAPATPRFFDSVTKAMIAADRQLAGDNVEIIKSVFVSRNIIEANTVKALRGMNFADIDIHGDDHVVTHNGITTVRKKQFKSLALSDYIEISAQSNNPLYKCQLDVPFDTYMEFNEKGNMVEHISVSEAAAVLAAKACVKYIDKNKMVDLDNTAAKFEKQFIIHENKLNRNFFICG